MINSHPLLLDWPDALNLKGDRKKTLNGVLYTFVWVIWKARNNKVFSDSQLQKENSLVTDTQALSFYWIKHKGRKWDAALWSSWCSDPLNTG